MLVSAIIPTFNRAEYIGRAIGSALDQRLEAGDLEVIVVDDESTDATAEVVARCPRVRYIRQGNRREGAARNTGAAHAQGRYLAFLDSDDYWLPGKLAADVARLEQADRPALVYSRAVNVDERERPLGMRRLPVHQGDVFWRLAREAFMPMSTVTVRADRFAACGGFNEDRALSGTADWELWLRLAARWRVGFVDQTRTCIRVHASSMLADAGYMQPAMLAGLRHGLADPVVAGRARGREGYIRACMYVTLALHAYGHNRRASGMRWLARAVTACPMVAFDARFAGALARSVLGRGMIAALKGRGSV